ncbi:MAG: hypothetical protein AAF236_06195 [Verrucomicrobiota bacterium]
MKTPDTRTTGESSDSLENTIAAARQHAPFGEARDLGFATRLRSRLAEEKRGASLIESIGAWSWRFSFGWLPVLIAVGAFLLLTHGASLPSGVAQLVTQSAEYLPVAF